MRKINLLLLLTGWLFALTGDELAQQMNDRKIPIDSKVDLLMTLTNKKGKTRTSYLRSIFKDNGTKQIIWFLAPADDKGVAFLKIEHDEQDDETGAHLFVNTPDPSFIFFSKLSFSFYIVNKNEKN